MYLSDNLDMVEWAWTLLSLVGVLLHIVMTLFMVRDRFVLDSVPTDARDTLYEAKYVQLLANIRNELNRAFKQAVFLVVGLRATQLPNPASHDFGQQAMYVLFMMMQVSMVLNSIADFHTRHEVGSMIDDKEEHVVAQEAP